MGRLLWEFRLISEVVEDRWEPVIKVSIQGRSLLIFDTGTGMDGEEMAKLKRIAYSEKRVGEEAGYKGIGRLAGIAVANKLKVSSTSYGDPKLHHFEFRAGDMRETAIGSLQRLRIHGDHCIDRADQGQEQSAARFRVVTRQVGKFVVEILKSQIDAQGGGIVLKNRPRGLEFVRLVGRQQHDFGRVCQWQGT